MGEGAGRRDPALGVRADNRRTREAVCRAGGWTADLMAAWSRASRAVWERHGAGDRTLLPEVPVSETRKLSETWRRVLIACAA